MAGELQFSISYKAEQDRLRLLASFADGVEMQFWLTRRMTKGLLDVADRLARDLIQFDIADENARDRVADFEREAAVEGSDFAQSYRGGEMHPLMKNGPRLITVMSLTPSRDKQQITIAITLDKAEKLTLKLAAKALWGLVHLIGVQARVAQWDLSASPANNIMSHTQTTRPSLN